MTLKISVLTVIAIVLVGAAAYAEAPPVGNLGYNSYQSYMSGGGSLQNFWGPGVGYPSEGSGEYYRRYMPAKAWGRYGYGTGHLGEGYGPYIYAPRDGPSPPGMFDEPAEVYMTAPPPSIKVKHGMIRVAIPNDLPGVRCVTVTLVAFNNAELMTQTLSCAPYEFNMPILDGVTKVRVRIDYINNGLSATAYPL